MKSIFKIALLQSLFVSFFFAAMPAMAKAPVWKVSKGDDYLYLGGTIHLLSKADYPLPAAFEAAYNKTDDIVLETDVKALAAPEVQGLLLDAMSYRDHRSLSNVLDREVFDELEALLKSKNIPIAVFDKFTPAGAMLVLLQYELQQLGLVDGEGVDAHFGKRAADDNKESIFLESFEEQLSFMKSMNALEPNEVIKSGIRDLENLKSVWADLLNAWRSGDLAELEAVGILEMRRDFPSLYQTILVQRNNDWLADIHSMMLSEDKEFILVGALHMAGKDGLISRLKAEGYEVKQLD